MIGLHNFLKVGKGMIASRDLSGCVAAGVLETLIAAIYVEGGSTPPAISS
jgi:dsRNA-specific ribonuclease